MSGYRWKSLANDTKLVYVSLLLTIGYTRESVGAFLGTKKNAIVGFQHRHLPWLTNAGSAKTQEAVDLEAFQKMLSKINMRQTIAMLKERKLEYVAPPVSAKKKVGPVKTPASENSVKKGVKKMTKAKRTKPRAKKEKLLDPSPTPLPEVSEVAQEPVPTVSAQPEVVPEPLPSISAQEGRSTARTARLSVGAFTELTDADVSRQLAKDLHEEAVRQKRDELRHVVPEKPVKAKPIPSKQVEHATCQYPLTTGKSLKSVVYCENDPVYMGCCHEHAWKLYPSYRRTHKKCA